MTERMTFIENFDEVKRFSEENKGENFSGNKKSPINLIFDNKKKKLVKKKEK